MNPDISIVMPIYNGGRFLSKAIESIQAQTFANFECLLCDGSTDGVKSYLYDISKKDKRFVIIYKRNMSLSEALQIGIENSKSKFIARMDSDDISLPCRIAVQYEYIRRNPDLVLLGTSYRYIDEKDVLGRTKILPARPRLPQDLLWGCPFLHPSVMMRRDAVLAAGGYRDCFVKAEDYDLWFRLQAQGRMENLKEVLVHYRLHGKNSTISHADATRRYAVKAQALYFLGATHDPNLVSKNLEELLPLLDADTRAAILARMLACHAHLFGDSSEDTLGALWLREIANAKFADKAQAMALWHMRCSRRYAKREPLRACSHIMKALKSDCRSSLKFVLNYWKGLWGGFHQNLRCNYSQGH